MNNTPYDENPLPRKGPIMDKNQDVSVARVAIVMGVVSLITITVLNKRIGHLNKELRNAKLIGEAHQSVVRRMMKEMTHSQIHAIANEINTNAEFVAIVIKNF